MDDGPAAPLAGCRVLDLADGSGAVCGRILAELGADVIKIEPPGGGPDRFAPPFLADRAGPDRSLTWVAGNVNKRGITLSLDDPRGLALFERLVATAAIVTESYAPGTLEAKGLGYRRLSAERPQLVLVSISPYGQDGPLAGFPGSDLEVTASSGSLWLAGEEDRPPVRTSQPQSPSWSGMYGAMGALMAYLAARTSGSGQHVDVSAQASMATVHPPAPIFWDVLGEEHRRLGPFLLGRSIVGSRFRNLWPCADGFVSFAIQGGAIGRHTGRMLIEWMASRGTVPAVLAGIAWEVFDNSTLTQDDVDRLEAAIGPFLLGLTKREFYAGVVERRMLGYPVGDAADVLADPQLEARDFWQTVAVDGEVGLPFPGGSMLFDGVRPTLRRAAPRLGEHNAEIYAEIGVGPGELAGLLAAAVL
jgi:benzylsuccinate CoA-transferase BbsE subunit